MNQQSESTPDYSLIIPAWNEAALIADTLSSVQQAMQAVADESTLRGELIVVDNNSSDETAAIAREAGALVVFEPVNQISRARNRGTTVAQAQILVFMDADTRLTPDLLGHALSLLVSGSAVGGGSLISADQPVTGVASAALRCWNWISKRTRMAAGCFIFCRRDAFDAIGGFNTRVYAGEEIYLSRLLKRWGKRKGMSFHILGDFPVQTSLRKLQWYGPARLLAQALIVLIPGAIYSRRLCLTWYDRSKD